MGLRIKEVCKEQNTTLTDVAKTIGINPVTLSQSINGNPTLKRLEEVADALDVDVSELFDRTLETDIHGCIYVEGEPHLVKSRKDLEKLIELVKENPHICI